MREREKERERRESERVTAIERRPAIHDIIIVIVITIKWLLLSVWHVVDVFGCYTG